MSKPTLLDLFVPIQMDEYELTVNAQGTVWKFLLENSRKVKVICDTYDIDGSVSVPQFSLLGIKIDVKLTREKK